MSSALQKRETGIPGLRAGFRFIFINQDDYASLCNPILLVPQSPLQVCSFFVLLFIHFLGSTMTRKALKDQTSPGGLIDRGFSKSLRDTVAILALSCLPNCRRP